MTTYYVDNSVGSDSNNGTSPTFTGGSNGPWASIAHVNAQTFNGGDSVLLQGGQTFTDGLVMGTGNWGSSPAPSAAAPVTFGSYGTGNATIAPSSNSVNGFKSLNLGAIVIQNLIFTGAGASVSTVDGVSMFNNTGTTTLDFIQLLNLTVSGFGTHGISIVAFPSPGLYSNVTISGCVSHDNTGAAFANLAGINTYGTSNLHIARCTVYNNAGLTGQSSWTGGGIFTNALTGGLIEYCETYNNGANSNNASGPVGVFVNAGPNVTVQFCESYANKTTGGDGDGFDLEICTGCIIQYCYSHDNYGTGFQLFSYASADNVNCTIRYCISQNDGSVSSFAAGIRLSNGSNNLTGAVVHNNTVYSSSAPAFGIDGATVASTTGRVCNNIIYTTGTHKLISFGATGNPSGLHFDGNNYFASGTFSADWNATNYGTLAAWKTGSSQETVNGGFSTDPSLTNPGGASTAHGYSPGVMSAYRLKQSSSMIGAGVNLLQNQFSINPGGQDFWGATVPNRVGSGWNVGADGFAYSAFTYGGWGETSW